MENWEQADSDNYAEYQLNTLHSKVIFDDLLSFATEVCLKRTPDYDLPISTTQEERLVSFMGLRGMRAAAELAYNYIDQQPSSSAETEDDEKFIRGDSPITYPTAFSAELDPSIQHKIEMFGDELLNEAYQSIGHDVYKKIAEIQSAKTAEEQMVVINWLSDRIDRMARDRIIRTEGSLPQDHFYHPIRLSPRVMGVYPKLETSPTCLGVSLIASSFFRKAGLNTLHAGVNISGQDHALSSAMVLSHLLPEIAKEKHDRTLPETAQQAISSLHKKTAETMQRLDAQHASVYVELADGSWAQFDPNFVSTFQIKDEVIGSHLSKVSKSLHDLHTVAPGLEVSTYLNDIPALGRVLEILLKLQDPQAFQELRVHATDSLQNIPPEAIPQYIYETCIEPFFQFGKDKDDSFRVYMEYLDDVKLRHETTGELEDIIEMSFYRVFEKYVLWGDSLEVFLQRISSDPSYAKNRIEDITNLPYMMGLAIAKLESENYLPIYPHHALDIGLPEYRIGAAVLSDFSLYHDFNLSSDFWMSYWPGNASVIEHIEYETNSLQEADLLRNNVAYYDIHPFTSYKNRGIVTKFLDTPNGEEVE